MIEIKDKYGNIRHSVEITDKCVYRKELMTEEYIVLAFDADRLIRFRKGDYIHLGDFGRFEIVTIDAPKESSAGGYSYEQKFHVAWERWKNRILFYKRQSGSEKAWKMTQLPQYFLDIVVENLLDAGFGEWGFQIDSSLSEMKLVEFDGTDILSALTKIAETWETEWWIADNVIHLSRCEFGTAVDFEIGNVVSDMEQDSSQDREYATRLYAFGSTRNLPVNYRKNDNGDLVIEGVVERRLKLPEGINYVDAWENMSEEDIVEGVAVFDEVYPHRIGTLATVTTKEYIDTIENEDGTTEQATWNAFRFTDTGIVFSKDYIIQGEELRLVFQTGSLAGMDFALTFFNVGETTDNEGKENAEQLWEIIRNEDYGIALPNDNFKPIAGDTYILYGYNTAFVSDALVPEAEQELLRETQALIVKTSEDKSVYTCLTNPIRCAGYKEYNGKLTYLPADIIDLDIGQKVKLVNDNYFDSGSRTTRIRAFEKRLDNKFNCTYDIGETSNYSRSAELDQKVEELTYQTTKYISGSSSAYIIKRHDKTQPTDHNVLSSLRAKAEFLHKQNPDTAQGLIRFLAGSEFGQYESGESGAKIHPSGEAELMGAVIRQVLRSPVFVDGITGEGFGLWKDSVTGLSNLTIDKLTVRQSIAVMELLINKVRSTGGQIIASAASGKIKTVEQNGDNYVITFEQENTFQPHDLMRCQTFTGSVLKSYWVEVSEVTGESITVPVAEFAAEVPSQGDECVLMGNTQNANRQNLISISASEDGQPRIDVLNGVREKNFNGCLRTRLGNLDGIQDNWFPLDKQPQGDGLYSDNAYLRGTFLLATGEDIKTRFEVTEGLIQSQVDSVRQDFVDSKGFLNNATFGQGMSKWNTQNEAVFFLAGNKWIWINNNIYSNKGDYAAVRMDDGRTTVFIRNNYIEQSNANLQSKPTFDTTTNGDGVTRKNAMPVYVSFFYRVAVAGELSIYFNDVDKTGFHDFNSLSITKNLDVTNGYQQFTGDGFWNGTGDFRLSFTGEIYLYMLILSTDRIEALKYQYQTLFEQSDKLVKIAAGSFDNEGNVLQSSQIVTKADMNLITSGIFDEAGLLVEGAGLVTKSDMASMFVIGSSGELVSLVQASTEGIKLKAENISLEGLVTVNENFRIDDYGNMWAADCHISGEIYATSGKIGGFNIVGSGLTNHDDFANGDAYVIFRNDTKGMFAGIGTSVFPSSSGINVPARFENGDTSNSLGTNIGVYVSASGGMHNAALYIGGGSIYGFSLACKRINSNTTLNPLDCVISCYNSSQITLTLPALPEVGKIYYIRINNSTGVTLDANGNQMMKIDGSLSGTNNMSTRGELVTVIWDGQYWLYNTTVQ